MLFQTVPKLSKNCKCIKSQLTQLIIFNDLFSIYIPISTS